MNYMKLYSYMMSEIKNGQEMIFFENLFVLIKLYIDEVISLKVEEAFNQHKINIETRLNDKQITSSVLKEEIVRQLVKDFSY